MIKISFIRPGHEKRELVFNQPLVMIGNGGQGVDISLPEEALQKIHIKLLLENRALIAMNVANDPSVSLNKIPFEKRLVSSGDLLQIGKEILQIEWALDSELEKTVEPSQEETTLNPKEREELPEKGALSLHKTSRRARWILWLCGSILFITLGCFTAGVLYFRLFDQIEREQKEVANTVSDIGMALMHAELFHSTPPKLNFSDIHFLEENVGQVLSPNENSLIEMDVTGKLKNHPYIIRIATELDLKQFIVIAQPIPGPLQDIFSQPSIVLDSHSMELFKLSDLKELNRLLAHANPLDEATGLELSRLIKTQGTPLFSPNTYVYQTPRYYPFGESLMHQMLTINDRPKKMQLKKKKASIKELVLDSNHPLYKTLTQLSDERENALKKAADNIDSLIYEHTKNYNRTFSLAIQEALLEYDNIDQKMSQKIQDHLAILIEEYNHLPMNEFFSYIEGAGLEALFQTYLERQGEGALPSKEEIQARITLLGAAPSLMELEQKLSDMKEFFTLKSIPNSELLIYAENRLHHTILQKIKEMLFEPSQSCDYTAQERLALIQILETAWVTDPSEYDYFLSAFDKIGKISTTEGDQSSPRS